MMQQPAPRAPSAEPPVCKQVLSITGLIGGTVVLMLLGGAALFVLATEKSQVHLAEVARTFLPLLAAGVLLVDRLLALIRVRVPDAARIPFYAILALGAVIAYFNAFKFNYPNFYHRWELYHNYLGARYFPELGYDKLYRCTVVAQDELGKATGPAPDGEEVTADLRKEARKEGRKIRNLGVDNLLVPATEALDHPEKCKDGFKPERWEQFKNDVVFFRMQANSQSWFEDMQKDHGFGMSPVWMIVGRILTSLHSPTVPFLQLLAFLDLFFLLGVFGALWWAFGWRVSAVGAIFWGCQAIATSYWTGGGFLRQDWLFWLVLAVCLLRRRHALAGGAAFAYSCLLNVFPLYAGIGLVVLLILRVVRTRRLGVPERNALIGVGAGAAVLVGLSMIVATPRAFLDYWDRREDSAATPLTNQMGLAVVVSHGYGSGPEAGRMKYSRDNRLADPFANWKRMRLERRSDLLPLEIALDVILLGTFVFAAWRLRGLWASLALGQAFIVALALLTCWNYGFLVLAAPLTRVRRWLEFPLFCLASLSQVLALAFFYIDDRYTALSACVILFEMMLVLFFFRLDLFKKPQPKAPESVRWGFPAPPPTS